MHSEILSPQIEAVIWDSNAVVRAEKDFGEDHPIVYYLTDASGNQSGFENGVNFLRRLIERLGIRLVCLEGGFGKLMPLEEWKLLNLPTPKQSYELELSEVLNDPPDFYGVDNLGRYRFATEAMESLISTRRSWSALLSRISRELSLWSVRSLSQPFGNLVTTLDRSKGVFPEEMRHLRSFARKAGIPLNRYKEMEILLSMISLEQQIDFRRANVEFKKLATQILDMLRTHPLVHVLDALDHSGVRAVLDQRRESVEGAMELLEQGFSNTAVCKAMLQHNIEAGNGPSLTGKQQLLVFSQVLEDLSSRYELRDLMSKQISTRYRRFLLLLDQCASLFAIPKAEYPALYRYIQYLNRFHETNVETILRELEDLRQTIIESARETDNDRLFCEVTGSLATVKRLFTLTATPNDTKRIQSDIHHNRLCQKLAHFIPGAEPLCAFERLSAEYEHCLAKALDYYAEMPFRSQCLAVNTVSTMLKTQQSTAILVTGGFHQEEVSNNFTSREISHLVIAPNIDRATSAIELESYFGRIVTQRPQTT